MTVNAGYLFYKKYFDDFTDSNWKKVTTGEYKEKNLPPEIKFEKEILENNIERINKEFEKPNSFLLSIDSNLANVSTFNLKTTNPGLLIGSGYSHETGIENEFKIGFFFDHTTGLPVIPGSSVKGVLRSVFPKPNEPVSKQNGKKSYLKNQLKVILNKDLSDKELLDLENSVFEGIGFDEDKKEKHIPMAQRDIFFDAKIIKTLEKDHKIFGHDSITPHKHPLKNPIPLKFLKVLPGVVFQFAFRLGDHGGISAAAKKALFQAILCDIGAGAKTNVGYGQFVKYVDQPVNGSQKTA